MRIVPTQCTRSDRPFQGKGASLYVGLGSAGAIAYRNLRAWPAGGRFTAGAASQIGDTNTLKTARVASVSDPTAAFAYTLPGSFASQSVYAQVRTFKDDVENETILSPARVDLDGSLNDASTIDGTATLLSSIVQDAGIVLLRFKYAVALTGIQPLLFRWHATGGPSSPADATANFVGGGLYEIKTPALLDSAPYTYTLTAEHNATVKTLLTGVTVQSDATGPTAATSGSATPW